MADSFASRAFRLATLPGRLAWRQTQTNIRTLVELREDIRSFQPILERATEETLTNIVAVLALAEQSLPPDIAELSPNERERAIRESLANGEKHLLLAMGEIYRALRLVTADDGGSIIENPPQEQLERD